MVTGPCFEPNGTAECSFGDISTPGIFVSRERVLCVSPAMDTLGRVDVTVEVRNENGDVTFQGNALFYSSKCALYVTIAIKGKFKVRYGRIFS